MGLYTEHIHEKIREYFNENSNQPETKQELVVVLAYISGLVSVDTVLADYAVWQLLETGELVWVDAPHTLRMKEPE